MSEIEVRMVRIDPMRVARANGFGREPEGIAWEKLTHWAAKKGLLEDVHAHRWFGFNHPEPMPGSPNYGYEQWMTVGADVTAGDKVDLLDFSGGLYAVTCTKLSHIGQTWRQLVTWVEGSPHTPGRHQWLEECLNPEVFIRSSGEELAPIDPEELLFDLFFPLVE
ncbi:MAG: GyrI-like domain-containing protein [Anaerolineaceae bacterium]